VAIGHYDKAYELYDEDISFLTNRQGHSYACAPCGALWFGKA